MWGMPPRFIPKCEKQRRRTVAVKINVGKVEYVPYENLMESQRAAVAGDLMQRLAAIRNGWALERFVKSPEPRIKIQVAKTGLYGLDVLAEDISFRVKIAAMESLKRMGTTLEEWKRDNPGLCAAEEKKGFSKEGRPPAMESPAEMDRKPAQAGKMMAKDAPRELAAKGNSI